MRRPADITEETRALLIALAERYEQRAFIDGDPSWHMHQATGPRQQEAVAFVAAALSYGSRRQFMPKISHITELAGGDVHTWLLHDGYAEAFRCDDTTCYYRLNSRAQMHRFLAAYAAILRRHGTLGEALRTAGVSDGPAALRTICRIFADSHCGLVPQDTASACKRLCMFLRWMVREGSPVDLGLWAHFIDRRTLIMPLDTHVVSEARRLGLTTCAAATMSHARSLTATVAQVFPDDPLRADFALFGYGVTHS